MTLGGRVSKCPPVASLLHVTAGIAGARPLEASRRFSWRAALALTALSLVADVDVLAFRFGVPYSDPFGPRGATHSLVFAVLAGTVTALLLSHGRRRDFWRTAGGTRPVAVGPPPVAALTNCGR